MEKKTGCRRRIVIKEDIFLGGVVLDVYPGELLGAQDFRSSPQHRFPPIALPMFLSWTESGFSPGFPCQYSIGVITKETISSWWRHQNFPTRLLKHGNGNVDDPQRWIQAFISISGFIIWLAIPPVLHELTWLVTSSRQRLTRNTEQEDVATLWVRHWWRHTSMTGSGGFTPGSPVSTHKKI